MPKALRNQSIPELYKRFRERMDAKLSELGVPMYQWSQYYETKAIKNIEKRVYAYTQYDKRTKAAMEKSSPLKEFLMSENKPLDKFIRDFIKEGKINRRGSIATDKPAYELKPLNVAFNKAVADLQAQGISLDQYASKEAERSKIKNLADLSVYLNKAKNIRYQDPDTDEGIKSVKIEDLTEEQIKNIIIERLGYIEVEKFDVKTKQKILVPKKGASILYMEKERMKKAMLAANLKTYEDFFSGPAPGIKAYSQDTQTVLRTLKEYIDEEFGDEAPTVWNQLIDEGLIPQPGESDEYEEKFENIFSFLKIKVENLIEKFKESKAAKVLGLYFNISKESMDKLLGEANINKGRVSKKQAKVRK